MTGCGGTAAHAASRAGQSNRALRINSLLIGNAAHLELPVHDGERKAPLDEVQCVLTELIKPPAAEDAEIRPDPGGERFEVVRPSDQARRDSGLLGADLQEQLQQVA